MHIIDIDNYDEYMNKLNTSSNHPINFHENLTASNNNLEELTPAIDWKRMKTLLFLVLLFIIDQFIEGSSKFDSIIGLKKFL